MRRVDRVLQKPRKTQEFLILSSFWETSKNARVFQKLRKTHEFFRNLEKRTSFSETSKDARVFQKPWKTHEILTLYLKVTIKEEAKNFCHSSKKNLWSDCRLSEFSRTMKFALVVPILLELFLATHACTEIRVTAEDKTVVVGRSMEFMIDLVSHIVVEPKDYPHSAELPKTCSRSSSAMTWTNSYKIAYLDAWDSPVGADGQNDAGLSIRPSPKASVARPFPTWSLRYGFWATLQLLKRFEGLGKRTHSLLCGSNLWKGKPLSCTGLSLTKVVTASLLSTPNRDQSCTRVQLVSWPTLHPMTSICWTSAITSIFPSSLMILWYWVKQRSHPLAKEVDFLVSQEISLLHRDWYDLQPWCTLLIKLRKVMRR